VTQISASAINEVLKKQLETFKPEVDVREVGTVMQIGDGIARCDGLKGAMAGELLEFVGASGHTIYGLALNLDEDSASLSTARDPSPRRAIAPWSFAPLA